MGKKSLKLPSIYLIGMTLALIGFCVPMFRVAGKAMGKTLVIWQANGFDLMKIFKNVDQTGAFICAILIFAGAVISILLGLISIKRTRIARLVSMVISIVSGLIVFFNMSDTGYNIAAKILFIGFYMLIAGWIIAIIGWILNK